MFKSFMLAISLSVFALVGISQSFADTMSDGVVRKVDIENGKITIKHGFIANLDMPPMSMVFTAEDVSILGDIAKGDKIKFTAVDKDGKLFVTQIQETE